MNGFLAFIVFCCYRLINFYVVVWKTLTKPRLLLSDQELYSANVVYVVYECPKPGETATFRESNECAHVRNTWANKRLTTSELMVPVSKCTDMYGLRASGSVGRTQPLLRYALCHTAGNPCAFFGVADESNRSSSQQHFSSIVVCPLHPKDNSKELGEVSSPELYKIHTMSNSINPLQLPNQQQPTKNEPGIDLKALSVTSHKRRAKFNKQAANYSLARSSRPESFYNGIGWQLLKFLNKECWLLVTAWQYLATM